MNIVHVISGDLWGGAEAQAHTLLNQLSKQKHLNVHAIVLNHGELQQRLEAAQISVTLLDETQYSSPWLLIKLCVVLKRLKPHVVHTHRLKENILGSLAAKFAGCSVCVRTVHGQDEHPPSDLWRTLPARLIRRVDHWCGQWLQQSIIAVSEELGEQLALTMPRAAIAVIPNGVDTQALKCELALGSKASLRDDQTHVALVGRLVPVKRADLFLDMAALLLQQPNSSWHFHIVGDGPLAEILRQKSTQLGITSHVDFHGQCPSVAALLAKMNVLVLCSDHEGLPMVALEALALGVPIVAHSTGGLKMLLPMHNLVCNHTAAGYAEKLRSMFKDAKTGQTPVALPLPNQFTAQSNGTRMTALYSELLASPSHVKQE
jgi:glycosyltransferase involved in cell wall biosynthesis